MKSSVILLLLTLSVQFSSAQTENQNTLTDSVQFMKPSLLCECIDFKDEVASFPGGIEMLNLWVKTNLQYPEFSFEMGEQGIVYVSFVIEQDGSLTNIEIQQGVSFELDREAVRLVERMPKWNPTYVKGKLVRSRCRVPISFKLI